MNKDQVLQQKFKLLKSMQHDKKLDLLTRALKQAQQRRTQWMC